MNNGIILPWFYPFLYPCEYKSLCGGRSSGKSRHMALFVVLRMAQMLSDPKHVDDPTKPYYPPGPVKVMSARQFNVTLPQSVKTVMENWIITLGLSSQFKVNRAEIIHPASGSLCFFEGIDRNVQNVLSYEGIDIWWFEQAEFLTREQMRLILPTARHQVRCPITGRIYRNEKLFVWNPKQRSDWAWRRFHNDRQDKDLHVHVNYDSNPLLPENMIELAEFDRIRYPEVYNHIWLGSPDDSDAESQVIPHKSIQACVDAWEKRPEVNQQMRTDAGFDVAVGGMDNCCLVVRSGPVVHDIITWRGVPNLNEAARKSNDLFRETCESKDIEPDRLYYDAAHPMEGAYDETEAYCSTEGVLFGGEVASKDEIWERDITNGNVFARRNIQMATAVRQRADRTARLLEGEDVDPWACLFVNPEIEDLDRAMGMISQPIRRLNPAGRWEIDKRGGDEAAKSPDEFDALCLAFAHDSEYGLRARD